jgi:hypothetical protein
MLHMTQFSGFASGGEGLVLEYLGTYPDTTTASTYSFPSKNIGVASSDRLIVIAITADPTIGTQVNSATITGGTPSVTIQHQGGGSGGIAALVQATVASGTSATIGVTFDGNCTNCQISVYRIVGLNSTTAVDSQFSQNADPSKSLTISAGGCAIAVAVSVANTSCAWTTTIENDDVFSDTHTHTASSLSGYVGGTPTITADFSQNTGQSMVLASWR